MSATALRWPLLLLVPALLSAPALGLALPETDDQVLVIFLGGEPLKVRVERFAKPLPVLAASPRGGGVNQMVADDTAGKETKKAPATLGPGSFAIVRRLDAASPKLYEACARGTHLPTTKWKNLVLKRGYIAKYSVERSGAVAIETIEIAYEAAEVMP
jgi:hypothetical protein